MKIRIPTTRSNTPRIIVTLKPSGEWAPIIHNDRQATHVTYPRRTRMTSIVFHTFKSRRVSLLSSIFKLPSICWTKNKHD